MLGMLGILTRVDVPLTCPQLKFLKIFTSRAPKPTATGAAITAPAAVLPAECPLWCGVLW